MRRVLGAVTVATLLLTGCGGDEAEADIRRFCELIEQYNKGTGFKPPTDETPEAQDKALRDYLALPEIQATLDELAEVAPEPVRDDVATMTKLADELVESGESRFQEAEAQQANQNIVEYTRTECAPEGDGAEGGSAEDDGGEAEEGATGEAGAEAEAGAADPADEGGAPAAEAPTAG